MHPESARLVYTSPGFVYNISDESKAASDERQPRFELADFGSQLSLLVGGYHKPHLPSVKLSEAGVDLRLLAFVDVQVADVSAFVHDFKVIVKTLNSNLGK